MVSPTQEFDMCVSNALSDFNWRSSGANVSGATAAYKCSMFVEIPPAATVCALAVGIGTPEANVYCDVTK